MDRKLTPQEVSELRGRLKAPKRGKAMRKRTIQRQQKSELDYQNQLAKKMQDFI